MAGQPPFFLMPPVDQTNGAGRVHNPPDLTKPKAASSSRGRKSNKAPASRMKQRKRGLGVAQLEQIINKMPNELDHPIPVPNPFQHVQVGVPLMVNTSCAFENGAGFDRNPSFGPFWSNPFVLGAPDYTRVLPFGSYNETSNELSSMPKLVNHFPSDSYCKGAEVVTVHRKMEAKGRKVFMEYDFFPDKNKNDTDFKEVEMLGSQSSKASSCLTTMSDCSASTTTPNSVDLSLKLSF